MLSILIAALFFTPSSLGAVDCRSACHACRANNQLKQMLEIYCAMCRECKERRKDYLHTKIEMARQRTSETTTDIITSIIDSGFALDNMLETPSLEAFDCGSELTADNVIQNIPPGCPTAPPCSEDEAPVTTTSRTTTTTSTTTTTPRPTCPPIQPCKKKPTQPCQPSYPALCCPTPPYIPCFPPPACPPVNGPGYIAHPGNLPQPLLVLPKVSTDADYLYMYVGVPKNALETTENPKTEKKG